MDSYLADRRAIDDLMTGWIRRDLAQWDAMRELFHPDGVIAITWFTGLFTDFVDASARMGESDLRTKHVITSPVVTFRGDRAVAETNAMVVAENVALKLGCLSHNRFLDRVEKRDGIWKIVDRRSIYDMGSFTFPCGIVDADTTTKYPPEYAALAYLLDKSGFPVTDAFATKGSDLEASIKHSAQLWLEDKQ
ncbi:nuclear transport factor 2 family protein [Rhodococcus koreensis]|uniref:nuclear transport factor 2 family protein n=1 Tax=Rhodococcus koreensis TaxID=99653 RepID=UPI0036DA74E7